MMGSSIITGSIPLFSVGRTPVRAHPSFALLLLFFAIMNADGFVSGIAIALAVFLSLLAHEFGHVFAARTNGHASVVVLWGMGGITIPQAQARGFRDIWMSAAGPLAGFVVAAFVWFFIFSLPADAPSLDYRNATTDESVAVEFWRLMVWINVIWGIFNLLPIFPMDGGQIVRAVFEFFMDENRALRFAAMVGIAGGAGLFLLGLTLGQYFMMFVAGLIAFQNWGILQRQV